MRELDLDCEISDIREGPRTPYAYSIRFRDRHAESGLRHFWIDLIWYDRTHETMEELKRQLLARVVPFLHRREPAAQGSPSAAYLTAVRAAEAATEARARHRALLGARQPIA